MDIFTYSPWVVFGITAIIGILVIVAMGLFGKNHMPVDGRTILLTGASEGMGRSAALQLAAKGAHVIIVARSKVRMEEVVASCQAIAKSPKTQRFHYITADVGKPDYAEDVVAAVTAWNQGRAPDVVWCVAGLAKPLLWAEDERALPAARYSMDVNYWGQAEMSRAILRAWLRPEAATGPSAEPKHLVFTASVLALISILGYATYTPTKAALRGLADTLAMEMALYPDNPVKVHIVFPATIASPGLDRENKMKPDVTLKLEESDAAQTPDEVASNSIAGLEKGQYMVPMGFTGELMRTGMLGFSPRNNWLFDTVLGWFVPIVWFFLQLDFYGKVSSWGKTHGHPSTYAKKE